MKRNHLLLAVILLGLFSCSSTHKVATWKSPDFEAKPYKKLLVWGLSDNVSVRATVEDEVAYFLNVKGIASVSGSDIAPPDRKALPNNIDDAKAVLEKNGFDCVMTMGLIDKKEKTRYVQGSSAYYSPMAYGYYGSFYTYYPYMYGNVYQPGHYETSQEVYIETNIWDVESGKLVWSQQTKTVDPSTVESFANSYARGIVGNLINEGILVPTK
ncbi:MAG: hypothetical protein KDC58_13230 [Cyclobacteriaceae bacterium]|nr:hypothetical protein [Cyclobacteriaceae bacterium]